MNKLIVLGAVMALVVACGDDAEPVAVVEDVGAPEDVAADVQQPPSPPALWDGDPLELVNVFVGTGADAFNVGNLFPGATTPFGMIRLSPDSVEDSGSTSAVFHTAGYHYSDGWVRGFSHMRLAGAGIGDYGNVLVRPGVGDVAALADVMTGRLPLDHDKESGSPGYYRLEAAVAESVTVTSELTATPRTGVHRYTWSGADEGLIAVDLGAAINDGEVTAIEVAVAESGELSGQLHSRGDFSGRYDGYDLFYVVAPSRPPVEVLEVGDVRVMRFDVSENGVVELQVGLSFVDLDGARGNLKAEAQGRSFDELRAAAEALCREKLSVVKVSGGTDTRRRLLYTGLYHSAGMPTLLSDVDGRYLGFDKEIHTADGWSFYSDLSLWDTYRTLHPLVQLLWPDDQRDFLRSLVAMGEQGGSLPRWPMGPGYGRSMVGSSADIVLGDAVTGGMADAFDVDKALELALITANGPAPNGNPGRSCIGPYLELGYCPADAANGAVSMTMEYSANDYCIARIAEHLGQTELAAELDARALGWKHHWDPEQGFFAPRDTDGAFADCSPNSLTDYYIEGSAWHYLFMLPHHVPELIETLGGDAAFVERLETFMSQGAAAYDPLLPNAWYYQGNEPDLIAPWLFGFAGKPERTRHWTEWIADTTYQLTPAGLAGNDDGGTMSAWWVLSAAGLYPLPCTGTFALSGPLFDRVVWTVPGGTLDIRAGDAQTWDGAPLDGPTVDVTALRQGGLLELLRD